MYYYFLLGLNFRLLPAMLLSISKFPIWNLLPHEFAVSQILFPLLCYPVTIQHKFCLLQNKDVSSEGYRFCLRPLFNKAFNCKPNFNRMLTSNWSQQAEMSFRIWWGKKRKACKSMFCWTKSSVSVITWIIYFPYLARIDSLLLSRYRTVKMKLQ